LSLLCKVKQIDCPDLLVHLIGANWISRDPLLGYLDALDAITYNYPENGALNLIINAFEDPSNPYFLILDEMNLSHVERYFADFLSAMESKEEICLHSKEGKISGVPSSISLPPNLFIIGTINVDETTYMFSPKVLDRANVIEFRVTRGDIESFFKKYPHRGSTNAIAHRGKSMGKSFVDSANKTDYIYSNINALQDALLNIFDILRPLGAEFGYRTTHEMLRFAAIAEQFPDFGALNNIIDFVILQKLLPKLHGTIDELQPTFLALGKLCLIKDEDKAKVDDLLKNKDQSIPLHYPKSFEKLGRLYSKLIKLGHITFPEA
jgi:5-methylcytosine-specific restriction protein B